MNLLDTRLAKSWLGQFKRDFLPRARVILQTLQLISHQEFESKIGSLLNQIDPGSSSRIALFPVKRISSALSRGENKRIRYSSAERIGHFLTSVARANRRLQVAPYIPAMRAERIKNIVLVDDIIGSGASLEKYCLSQLDKSIKSWYSYHKCKLWVIVYAGHMAAIDHLTRKFSYLSKENILLYLKLPKLNDIWGEEIIETFKIYGKLTSKPGASLGVGDVATPIVFQHGCPNNAPAILWAGGNRWQALFINRSIPPEIYRSFESDSKGEIQTEALWRAGQYGLALGLLDRIENKRLDAGEIQLLTVIGLMLKGVKPEKLASIMFCGLKEVNKLILLAKRFELVDKYNRVTELGRELIERYRYKSYEETSIEVNEEALRNYFPQQYMGVRRKSS